MVILVVIFCVSISCLFYQSKVLSLNEEESKEKSEFYYLDEIEELGFDHGAILCEFWIDVGRVSFTPGSSCSYFITGALWAGILIFQKRLFFTVGHSILGTMDIWHVLSCVQIKI